MPLPDFVERAKRYLTWRALAYRRVFAKDNQDAKAVLADLSRFCRASESTFHPDPHVAARLDGRREVWLRIAAHLNLTTEELYQLFNGQKNPGG